MFVQRDQTGAVIGWGPTVRTPDGTVWTDPGSPPPGWVWDSAFTGPQPSESSLTDMQAQLAAQQTLVDQLLDALGGKP